ncbi:GntR family transcriptional regulator [Pseudonocardia kunmingensis]|uniref:DNA-binding GntR family transcriptional regulator n=1 Tax=Pseudonocardia kunmingensis TaxID=630975 RepID=A0A543D0C2_9PSEU|nr:GntR family transcriptional regulator [Pseudonocardia kunmingensis]TQM02800.1 DNA-binding GntR family transcriptional regulator [Pseudonocardia kunmingensis]
MPTSQTSPKASRKVPRKSTQKATGVARCLAEIRRMIATGELLPGQKVHQAELAAQLDMSRIPVREALSTLQAEGVLVHKPNTGFTVGRFSSEDLSEIYLMRRLLETEIIRSIDLATVDADELDRLDGCLDALSPADEPDAYQSANLDFHFRLFEYSALTLVRQEVSRLWYMSSFYRSLYLDQETATLQVHDAHQRIIQAVRDQDVDALIAASDAHRAATEELVIRRLGRSRPR